MCYIISRYARKSRVDTPGKVVPLGLMRVWAAGAAERLTEWQLGRIYFGRMADVRTFV